MYKPMFNVIELSSYIGLYDQYSLFSTLSVGCSDTWFEFSIGLEDRTTAAIQRRQVVYSGSNFQKNSRQTDMKEWS